MLSYFYYYCLSSDLCHCSVTLPAPVRVLSATNSKPLETQFLRGKDVERCRLDRVKPGFI